MKTPREWLELIDDAQSSIAAERFVAAAMQDAARHALCGVLDRLGGDGVTAALNGATPEQVSDDIWELSRWLEQRARESERERCAKVIENEIEEMTQAAADERMPMPTRSWSYGRLADAIRALAPADKEQP